MAILIGAALCLPAAAVAQVEFLEHSISTAADLAWAVHTADLDGDGDLDVLSSSSLDHKIAWYESDGSQPPAFVERVISTNALNARGLAASDLDADGDLDVLSASAGDDKIAWYENDGATPPAFTERVISTTALGAYSVFAIDVDRDGDTDVLSASLLDHKIAWYASDGGSPPVFAKRVITTDAEFAWSVFAADMDSDLDVDVLAAFQGGVALYENDGGFPPTFTERLLSVVFGAGHSVSAADIDADGDRDVLLAAGSNSVRWYENDGGSPAGFTEHVISTSGVGTAMSIGAGDVDGDGDGDIFAALWSTSRVVWYENDGGSPPSFDGTKLADVSEVRGLHTADLDADGDVDVLTASQGDDEIAWFENLSPIQSPVATVVGMDLRDVSCRNATTGEAGKAGVPQGTISWSCDDLGVAVESGDQVILAGAGTVIESGPLGGAVEVLGAPPALRVVCQNLTTAQTVQFSITDPVWDCEAAGLVVSLGHKVLQSVGGEA